MAVLSVVSPHHHSNDDKNIITDNNNMCTPSSTEMYRVVNFGDPETYPGTFGFGDQSHDKIEVVSSEENSSLDLEVDQTLLSHEEDKSSTSGTKKKPSWLRKSILRQAMATIAANMVHLSGGYAAGFSAPTSSSIQTDFDLDDSAKNWFASILVVGQVIGCLLGGPISDLIGRRKSLLIFLTLSLIGWFILASSHFIPQQEYAVTLLFSGRFLHGLADSLGVSPAIMYVSEVSSVKSRGMLMNSAAIAASGGIPIVYMIGSFWSWHGTAIIGCCFPLLAILIFLFGIHWDSPVFLVNKNQHHAVESLKYFREGSDLSKIMNEFKCLKETNQTKDNEFTKQSWFTYFAKEDTLRPFMIVMALLGLLPLSGVMSVTFFAMELFKGLGFAHSTLPVAVASGTLRAFGSFVSGIIVVFKGRRYVLMLSCIGSIVFIEIATIAILLKEYVQGDLVIQICDWILIIAIPAYMLFLGVGMIPVPWILLGEWFVAETRSLVGGIASGMFFLSVLVSLQLTGLLENTIGVQGMFMSFGFICILFFVVAYKCVPETHGKTYRDSVLIKKYQTQWMMPQGIQDKPISVAV